MWPHPLTKFEIQKYYQKKSKLPKLNYQNKPKCLFKI